MNPVRAIVVPALVAGAVLIIATSRPAFATPCTDAWAWTQKTSLTAGQRWDHCAIWDPNGQRMIIFGGRNASGTLGDTRSWSPATNTWTQLTPGSGPGVRWGATAIYDATRQRMVVFGGTTGAGGFPSSTWALSLTGTPAWTQLTTLNDPTGRYKHVAVYDPVNDRMVVYGGSPVISETWALSFATNTWALINDQFHHVATDGCAAVYDPVNQRLVVIGGTAYLGSICPDPSVFASSQVSVLPLNVPSPTWSTLGHVGPGISQTVAAYDATCQRILIYGGIRPSDCVGSCNAPNDNPWEVIATISLTGPLTWTQLSTTGGPPFPRGHHVGVFDGGERRLFVFGGGHHESSPGPPCGPFSTETDSYRNDTWQLQIPDVTPPGGGGGCPFAHVLTADGWTEENSILGRSLDGGFVRDAYRVKAVPLVENGVYRLKIREDEQETTTLDRVRLVAMDHDPGLVAFGLEGRPALGRIVPARQVVTAAGEDLAQTLAGSRAGRFLGRPGDELVFDFADAGAGGSGARGLPGMKSQLLVIRVYKKQETRLRTPIARNGPQHDAFVLGNTGIRLEAQDGSGRWTAVTTRYPREHQDDVVVEAPAAQRYRLVFVGEHGITFVGRLEPVAGAGTEASLIAAAHSGDGDVRAAVRDDDGATLTLGHGEQLELSFRLPEPATGKVRDVFLLSTGVYTTATQGADAARAEPLRLTQNQPNPFRVDTEIGFTLPRAADVRLEVFDPLGRRVAVLAAGRMTSGVHSVSWNRLDPGRSPVKPGVYLYRLTAGREVAQKRMIVLP